jgi:hypothetical protein
MTNQNQTFLANAVFAVGAIFATASHAQAGFIMIVQQVGSDVVETGSGTINLSGLSLAFAANKSGNLESNSGEAIGGPASATSALLYGSNFGPSSFGSGGYVAAHSGSGDLVGVDSIFVFVPSGYVSGAALSDTSTWTNTTLATLGLTTGTYTWTWGSGATADSFELDIGQSSAPEPSTFGLLALAAGGLMLGCYLRRAPVVKMDAACSSPSGRIFPTEV